MVNSNNKLPKADLILYLVSVYYLCFVTTTLTNSFLLNKTQINTAIGTIIAVYCIIYLITSTSKTFFIFLLTHRWLLAFLIFGLVSCLWAHQSANAFKLWIHDTILYLLFFTVGSSNNKKVLINNILTTYSLIVVAFSFIWITFLPQGHQSYTDGSVSIGIFYAKNVLGTICGLLIFINILFFNTVQEKYKKAWYFFIIFGLLVLVYLCQAKTAWGATILGLMVVILYYVTNKTFNFSNKRTPVLLFSIISFFVSGCILFKAFSLFTYAYFNPFNFIVLSSGKDLTFTGRTEVWPVILDFGLKNYFWLGAGYNSFNPSELITGLRWDASHAHNGYLQYFLDFGIIGFLLFFRMLVDIILRAISLIKRNIPKTIFLLGMLSLILFDNFFEIDFRWFTLYFVFSILVFLDENTTVKKAVIPSTIKL